MSPRISRTNQNQTTAIERTEFASEFERCWVCSGKATDTHEIVRGSNRQKGYMHRCCWIRTCRKCHDNKLGSYQEFPVARQLALKKLHDPSHYDRQRVNVLRDRQPDAITEEEVATWAMTLPESPFSKEYRSDKTSIYSIPPEARLRNPGKQPEGTHGMVANDRTQDPAADRGDER